MKQLILFSACLLTLVSCQQDGLDLHNPSVPVLQSPSQVDHSSHMDNVHPSILKSTWWQSQSPGTQRLLAVELSDSQKPVTYAELEKRMDQVHAYVATRAPACPGFPMGNPAGDVTLNSQADVNAFGALNCKEIMGALLIDDTMSPDPICDLTPLKGIKKIGSSLSIISDCLTDLDGMEKLKSVGELGPFGFVGVIGASLTNIEALSKLNNVTGSINIIDCDQLTSVTSAFSQITTIESGKSPLSLTSIFVLNINGNDLLTDMSAFSGLTYIEGGLRILTNGALADLDDLSGLNTIGDNIFILENTALQNVNELSNISSIQNTLWAADNPSLTQCCGLYSLLCSNPPACSSNSVGGVVFIDNNGSGCTEADIIAGGACP